MRHAGILFTLHLMSATLFVGAHLLGQKFGQSDAQLAQFFGMLSGVALTVAIATLGQACRAVVEHIRRA